MRRLINRLPMTKIKIFLARVLYRLMRLFYHRIESIIVREWIKYEVDLSEGIELSVFLFGSFQKYISLNNRLSLSQIPSIRSY